MVPQLRQSTWSRQTRASGKSKLTFALELVGNLTETVLDEAVWSRGLPDDILCTILACLPLSSFFRLRCVCKKWNLITHDPIFVNAYTRVSSQEASLLVASREGPHWIYEYGLNSWKCISPSFFWPKHLDGTWSPVAHVGHRLLLTSTSGWTRLAFPTVSGFRRDDDDYPPLVVYNPLNGIQETLPPMLGLSGSLSSLLDFRYALRETCVIGMPVNPPLESFFRIVVMVKRTVIVSDSSNEVSLRPDTTLHVELYDSRTSEWTLKEIVNTAPGQHVVLSVALFDDALLYLTVMDDLYSKHYRKVSDLLVSKVTCTLGEFGAYEWDLDGGRDLCFSQEDRVLRLIGAHIFVTRGRLMLAVVVPFRTTNNKAPTKWKRIIIWEMLDMGNKMMRLAEIDLKKVDLRISQFGLGTCLFSKGDSLYFGSNSEVLFGIINIPTKTWRLLPPFPGFVYHGGNPATTATKYMPLVYQPGFDLVAYNPFLPLKVEPSCLFFVNSLGKL